MKNILFLISFIITFFLFGESPAQAALGTCKPGERPVVIVDGHEVRRCWAPITKKQTDILMKVIQATTPPPKSPQLLSAEKFCEIYLKGTGDPADKENADIYCKKASSLGSEKATSSLCRAKYNVDPKSDESLSYCSKSASLGNKEAFLYISSIYENRGDFEKLKINLLKAFDYNVIFHNSYRPKKEITVSSPTSKLLKNATNTYLSLIMTNGYGAKLEDIGLRPMQIRPQISQRENTMSRLLLWYSAFRSYSSSSNKEIMDGNYRAAVFVVASDTSNYGEVVHCVLVNEEDKLVATDSINFCDRIVEDYKFSAAVDIDGDTAPGYIIFNANVRNDTIKIQ